MIVLFFNVVDGVIVLFLNVVSEYPLGPQVQIEYIAKKYKTKNRLKEPQKILLTFKFFAHFLQYQDAKIPRRPLKIKAKQLQSDLVFTSKKDPMAIM